MSDRSAQPRASHKTFVVSHSDLIGRHVSLGVHAHDPPILQLREELSTEEENCRSKMCLKFIACDVVEIKKHISKMQTASMCNVIGSWHILLIGLLFIELFLLFSVSFEYAPHIDSIEVHRTNIENLEREQELDLMKWRFSFPYVSIL